MKTKKVIFYSLNQKFLDSDNDVPANSGSRQVMYYSLAIGHHVGVIDCLRTILTCPFEECRQWFSLLPQGAAKQKMEGLFRFGEITIDRTHTRMLMNAFNEIRPNMTGNLAKWTDCLLHAFSSIEKEPAIYLMVRAHS